MFEDKRFPIELRPQASAPKVADSDLSFEAVESPVPTTAAVTVWSRDRLARVAVVDGRGNEIIRGYGRVDLPELAPGPYRVSAELTSEDRVEETIYVQAGQTYDIPLNVAASPIGPALIQRLEASNIWQDGEYSAPSEHFGPVANARLGSILAYAAWAARWPESEGFSRLRAIGVDPLQSLQSPGSALQVLIGDVAEMDAAFAYDSRVQIEVAVDSPLVPDNVVVLGGKRSTTMPLSLAPLERFPVALQASTLLPPGPVRVRVEMPGFAPTSFALSLLPGFVTVLVISREEDGDVDVQQYLNPIDPLVPVAPGFNPPMHDDVRLVELAWRALQGRNPLDAVEYNGLLQAKRSNPLLGIIAGYRMFRTEREDQFRVTFEPLLDDGELGPSPLWNLVRRFPGLPDVHVLAGMYDKPERRDEHFQRAMDTGTPVLVEGFWTLVEWLTARSMRENRPPPTLQQSVLPGMVWTSFTDVQRAPIIESLHVVTPTGRNYTGDASDALVPELARSVGRLEASGGTSEEFLCTGFLVAPQLLLCPIHFAVLFGQEQPDGSWMMQKEASVRFDLGDPASERKVTRIVRTLRPQSDLVADGGTLPRAALDQCWPVLLLLSEPAAASPLVIAREAPEIGQRVAVIGFPRSDARILSETFAKHFAGSAGEKHVMQGSVLRSPGESWTLDYDCFTADGTSGGPVVDLETGAVVGMHVAGSPVTHGRKRGIAIAMTRFSEDQPSWAESVGSFE